MCGIAGFLSPDGERADRRLLERMVATLRHRGPDATGYHVDGRLALGVARLRVVDLETGDQPIGNEDGTVHVALNGEIYNFPQLQTALRGLGHRFVTRSDTEVLVHAWEEYGEHCLDQLDGMFAFALWDRRREQLLLARRRMHPVPTPARKPRPQQDALGTAGPRDVAKLPLRSRFARANTIGGQLCLSTSTTVTTAGGR